MIFAAIMANISLRKHLLEKFSSRSWIKCGVISCSPHTSFDEIDDSVVNS